MKKKILLLICVMVFSQTVFADDIVIKVDGEVLNTPAAAKLVNDRTMLPMRSIFEKLGAEVTWFDNDQIIFVSRENTLIVMQIGNSQLTIQKSNTNEKQTITLDTVPYIDGDYTYVPVRAVAEALDANVDWVDEEQTVLITNKKGM